MDTVLSLRLLFPEFIWAKEADDFLETIRKDGMEFGQQVRMRCVRKIKTLPLLVCAGVMFEEGFFTIVFSDTLDMETAPHFFGHELAHTFHLKIINSGIHDLVAERRNNEHLYGYVENFCDVFSGLWLGLNGPNRVQSFITKYLNSPLF